MEEKSKKRSSTMIDIVVGTLFVLLPLAASLTQGSSGDGSGDANEFLGKWANPDIPFYIEINNWPPEVDKKPDPELHICGNKTGKLVLPVQVGLPGKGVNFSPVGIKVLKLPNKAYGGLYAVDGETYLYYWYKGWILFGDLDGPTIHRVEKSLFGSLILETAESDNAFCLSGCSKGNGIQEYKLERVQ